MMLIHSFLENLHIKGKKHVVLVVTPKNEYPIQILGDQFYKLEDAVLTNPKSYISLYEEGQKEIMQYAAFRLFLSPAICDKYSLSSSTTEKVRRLSKSEIVSFFVIQHFYDTVPYSEKDEEEAISKGKEIADNFLKSHPTEHYEYAFVIIGKDSNEANVLLDINFNNASKEYYLAHVYAN